MLIGWATPYSVRSAIGAYSRFLCSELVARGHEVEVIRTETGPELELDALPGTLPIVDASTNLDRFDVLVVNVGNHAPYHARMLDLFSRRAPLAIFHDLEMRHFDWGMHHRHNFGLPRLVGGEHEISEAGQDELIDPEARPLLAVLAAMASAAVVHGPHYRATVAAYCPGAVEVIPLCFPDTGKARRKKALSPGRRVTIFGMINDHKQPRRVLEAIALLGDSVGGVELHLAGACEDHYRDALLRLAEQLGVASPVFHGYIPDERLQDLVEDSHAICCLRNPVTEGSSASLATALYRGRPLIISDIASFSLVPDEVAYKVSYGDDPGDVADALREIFTDPQRAQKKASRAAKWAKDRFSATTYADAFEPVLVAARRNAALMNAARILVPALSTADHEPAMPAIHEFATVLDWMEASQK